jgi:uncharacterized CHY-type Zn-finger protein
MTGKAGEDYECAECGGTFERVRSDEEAMAEAHQKFDPKDLEDSAIICEECYQKIAVRHAKWEEKCRQHEERMQNDENYRTIYNIVHRLAVQIMVNDIIGPVKKH